MKINPIQNMDILRSYKANRSSSVEKPKQSSGDEVTISSEGLSFSKVLAGIREQVEVRSAAERAHIDEVTELVRQGRYFVDSGAIADKMLSDSDD